MRKVVVIAVVCAAVLSGCSSAYNLSIDDSYHWEDPHSTPVAVSIPNTQPESVQQSPSMEIVQIQDTTITVRIKR